MTLNFCPSKFCWKITFKQGRFFDHQNYVEKSKWKQHRFFDQRNDTEKSLWKQCGFFDHRNYVKKKAHGNDVDFPISEVTLTKYVEMTWKFFKTRSLTYRRNIDIKSTSIRRGVSVGLLINSFWSISSTK